jgi:3'(2'),5'-bisphosphate nucleotidase
MSLSHEMDAAAREFARIALLASQPVMRVYADGPTARLKADQSPVTAADEEAEALIIAALARSFPGVPVVAEEACARDGVPREAPVEAIFVDPLDGTREFLAHNGEFTINIGLVRNGAPVAGAVYAPAFGRLWWGGAQAFGAHLTQGQILPEPQDCAVLRTRSAALPLVALESRSHQSPQTRAAMARLAPVIGKPMGSSIKFCLIASGEADVCLRFGPTMEWDTAAGDAILRAAGGMTAAIDGAALMYGKAGEGFRNPNYVAWGDRSVLRDLSEFEPR